MREIKFRAWDKKRNWMLYDGESCGYIDMESHAVDVVNFILSEGYNKNLIFMQYTGFKNFLCSEIYEADIVKGKYWIDGKEYPFIGEVKFLAPSFQVVGINEYKGMNQELHPLYEVMGNIYEHSHLLEDNQ